MKKEITERRESKRELKIERTERSVKSERKRNGKREREKER